MSSGLCFFGDTLTQALLSSAPTFIGIFLSARWAFRKHFYPKCSESVCFCWFAAWKLFRCWCLTRKRSAIYSDSESPTFRNSISPTFEKCVQSAHWFLVWSHTTAPANFECFQPRRLHGFYSTHCVGLLGFLVWRNTVPFQRLPDTSPSHLSCLYKSFCIRSVDQQHFQTSELCFQWKSDHSNSYL